MAIFTKFAGEWGVLCTEKYDGKVQEGSVVEVRKANGERVKMKLAKHLGNRDDGATIWAGDKPQSKASNSTRTFRRKPRESGYCYYPCPVTGRKCCPENGPCHDCE